jgi:hypothetical protein
MGLAYPHPVYHTRFTNPSTLDDARRVKRDFEGVSIGTARRGLRYQRRLTLADNTAGL